MFKMQTDNHIFRKNVATDRNYILRKMNLKFKNPIFSISCKTAFYIFFARKCETFGVKRLVRPFWN